MAQVEYMVSTVREPQVVGVIGDSIISISGTYNEASIYNGSVSLRYTANKSPDNNKESFVYNNYMYYHGVDGSNYRFLYRIDKHGNVEKMSSSNYSYTTAMITASMVMINNGTDDYIVFNSSRVNLNTKVLSQSTGVLGSPGAIGNKLYFLYYGTLSYYDNETFNLLESFSISNPLLQGVDKINASVVRGDTIWWYSSYGLVGINTLTNSIIQRLFSPSGFPFLGIPRLRLASDGYLYGLIDTNNMMVINPDTGQWKSIPLSPSRDQRYHVIPYGDKLIVPSGKPDTWV